MYVCSYGHKQFLFRTLWTMLTKTQLNGKYNLGVQKYYQMVIDAFGTKFLDFLTDVCPIPFVPASPFYIIHGLQLCKYIVLSRKKINFGCSFLR